MAIKHIKKAEMQITQLHQLPFWFEHDEKTGKKIVDESGRSII